MEALCRKWDISFRTGPPYSPWSNGINERNHHSCDVVVNRLLMEDPKMKVQVAINKAAWVHNTNISGKGFTPLQIATGQGSKIPTFGIQKLKDEIEALSAKEQVEIVMRIQ